MDWGDRETLKFVGRGRTARHEYQWHTVKRWELDEREGGRRQHFTSHAVSLSQIESYYVTPVRFPQ